MAEPNVVIEWKEAERDPERWRWTLALYAILHPETDAILYIGKAHGTTVLERFEADDKHNRVWDHMRDELGLETHGFIIGGIDAEWPRTDTEEAKLVADIECLLIFEVNKIF